jgi:hypothetical protein
MDKVGGRIALIMGREMGRVGVCGLFERRQVSSVVEEL